MSKKRFMTYIAFGAFALFTTSCATTDSNSTTGGTSQAAIQKDQGSAAAYREFGDILIPGEMESVSDASFIYVTSGLAVGVMSLKGHVETDSLISFFQGNMAKDNWKLVSYFKSPKTLMLFRKETRWSVINITEGPYYSYAEIWVAPTLANADSSALK